MLVMLRKVIPLFGKKYKHHNQPISNFCLRITYNFVNFPISSKYYYEQLPNSLQASMALAKKENKLNEKIYLLEHVGQLIALEPKLKGNRVQKFMVEQLKLWIGSNGGRFERVSAIIWIIKKMKLQKQLADLYQEITNRIHQDQWYVDFDQAVKAIEALADDDHPLKNKIMQKIQRNLMITMGDVSMTYYQRICKSLSEAGRYQSPLWNKLEHFVTRNLSMDYSIKTFLDIFKYFALTKNGSIEFYQICQQIVHQGHLYKSKNLLRMSGLAGYELSGDYFGLLVQTYGIIKQRNNIPLSNDFLNYIYKGMLSSKVEYRDISSLKKIIKYMPQIQFLQEEVKKVIYDVIQNKKFCYYCSLEDIREVYAEVEGALGHVPTKLKHNIEDLIQKDIKSGVIPLPNAIQLVDFVLGYRDAEQKKKLSIIQSLNKSIDKKYKYLEAGQKKEVRQMLKDERIWGNIQNIKLLLQDKNFNSFSSQKEKQNFN